MSETARAPVTHQTTNIITNYMWVSIVCSINILLSTLLHIICEIQSTQAKSYSINYFQGNCKSTHNKRWTELNICVPNNWRNSKYIVWKHTLQTNSNVEAEKTKRIPYPHKQTKQNKNSNRIFLKRVAKWSE